MSYTPTQWQTGDTITAERLNNMESGIEAANETLVIHAKFNEQWVLISVDCPAADARDAIRAGKNVEILFEVYSGDYLMATRKARPTPFIGSPNVIGEFFVVWATTDVPVPPRLQLSDDGWGIVDGTTVYPNASFELGFYQRGAQEGSMAGKVFGFNHMDPIPYWRAVNNNLLIGDMLDPLIAGAMQMATAAGGKATITTAITGADAEAVAGAMRGWFENLAGGFNVLNAYGTYYKGAIALTTRMHASDDTTGDYTDLQTGTFQIPALGGSAGAYSVDTLWNFTLSIYTKRETVSVDPVDSANIVLTAEEITPAQVS